MTKLSRLKLQNILCGAREVNSWPMPRPDFRLQTEGWDQRAQQRSTLTGRPACDCLADELRERLLGQLAFMVVTFATLTLTYWLCVQKGQDNVALAVVGAYGVGRAVLAYRGSRLS